MKHWLRVTVALLGLSQLHAACSYSPPPLPTHGQGADTLGPGNAAVGIEGGRGTLASWWNARYLGDPDVHSGFVGAGRLRLGTSDNVDVSALGALGPEHTTMLGGELKWRFAHFAPAQSEGNPGFHAANVTGIGVGALDLQQNAGRHAFIAPYTGLLVSGGIEAIEMFVGLRVAASEVIGNDQNDLTVYPMLGYGVLVRPTGPLALHAEAVVAAGITTEDTGDTALLVYPSVGATLTFDHLFGPTKADVRASGSSR
jgi:hypothetical protein